MICEYKHKYDFHVQSFYLDSYIENVYINIYFCQVYNILLMFKIGQKYYCVNIAMRNTLQSLKCSTHATSNVV